VFFFYLLILLFSLTTSFSEERAVKKG